MHIIVSKPTETAVRLELRLISARVVASCMGSRKAQNKMKGVWVRYVNDDAGGKLLMMIQKDIVCLMRYRRMWALDSHLEDCCSEFHAGCRRPSNTEMML